LVLLVSRVSGDYFVAIIVSEFPFASILSPNNTPHCWNRHRIQPPPPISSCHLTRHTHSYIHSCTDVHSHAQTHAHTRAHTHPLTCGPHMGRKCDGYAMRYSRCRRNAQCHTSWSAQPHPRHRLRHRRRRLMQLLMARFECFWL
jgi:hypothetical protein